MRRVGIGLGLDWDWDWVGIGIGLGLGWVGIGLCGFGSDLMDWIFLNGLFGFLLWFPFALG